MLDPKVVLVDEPSPGLSPRTRHHVFAALHALATHQVGVLLVERNAVQALVVADRGLVVEPGRVAKSGTGPAMLDDPDVPTWDCRPDRPAPTPQIHQNASMAMSAREW
ncbi:hypothetical protein [Micromonospora inyonensis]|uniref:hypothetical protein n=1 Tax=Micromonospora inyonensis TaxID=47866 RepID=UPI00114CB658|nr:hypothetical protein [Micromonospora inyonensis]